MRRVAGLIGMLVALVCSSAALARDVTLWEQEDQEVQGILDRLFADFSRLHPDIVIKRGDTVIVR